jgi:hypothetical protein
VDAEARDTHNDVISSAQDMAGDLSSAILNTVRDAKVALSSSDLSLLKDIAIPLSHSTHDQHGRAARSAIVPSPFFLCQHPITIADVLERIAALAPDPDTYVRFKVAQNLATLYALAPEEMWEIAEEVTEREQDQAVLQAFVAAFLGLAPHDPTRVEPMLLSINERFQFNRQSAAKRASKNLNQSMAQLFASLYVWQNCELSIQEVFRWASGPPSA